MVKKIPMLLAEGNGLSNAGLGVARQPTAAAARVAERGDGARVRVRP